MRPVVEDGDRVVGLGGTAVEGEEDVRRRRRRRRGRRWRGGRWGWRGRGGRRGGRRRRWRGRRRRRIWRWRCWRQRWRRRRWRRRRRGRRQRRRRRRRWWPLRGGRRRQRLRPCRGRWGDGIADLRRVVRDQAGGCGGTLHGDAEKHRVVLGEALRVRQDRCEAGSVVGLIVGAVGGDGGGRWHVVRKGRSRGVAEAHSGQSGGGGAAGRP